MIDKSFILTAHVRPTYAADLPQRPEKKSQGNSRKPLIPKNLQGRIENTKQSGYLSVQIVYSKQATKDRGKPRNLVSMVLDLVVRNNSHICKRCPDLQRPMQCVHTR